jgi:hypothetical protein
LLRAVVRIAVLAVIVVGPAIVDRAKAESSVAVDFFYDDLAPQGFWVRDRNYGMVWYPATRDPDWQPYVYGQWVYTVEYGWCWESDEPWGWATYHYGRWVYTSEYGWVWVPDDEWGPAWVEWRYGGGYVGWAPMPPEATWRRGTAVYAGVDLSAPRFHPSWVFVGEADFARGSIRQRRMPAARNQAMLGTTMRTGGYSTINGRIVNLGVDVTQISAAAKVRIAPAVVIHSQSRSDVGVRTAGRITIYQPKVAARATLHGTDRGPLRFDTDDRVDVRPSAPDFGGSVGGSVGVGSSVGGSVGIGRGGNIGGSIGGGGVRLGR